MAIVDERGRLFGRLNLLDAALLVLVLGLIPLGYGAYALFRETPPVITSVSPASVQQPSELDLTVRGEHLRPHMRVSAGPHQAVGLTFKGITEISARFLNLPAGEYDVILYDQAQERSRLPKALSVLRSAMPATQLAAIGAFGDLDESGAAKITAGVELPELGTVAAVAKPGQDATQVLSAPGLVGVPNASGRRVPAVIHFRCHVRTQQGRPHCMVGDTAVEAPNLLMLPTPAGQKPFQIEKVRSIQPLESVQIRVRLAGAPSVLSLIRAGDMDLGGTANPLALLAKVASAGTVRRINEGSAEIDVTLIAELQRVDGGWLYDSAPLRAGMAFQLRTSRYQASGTVIDVPSPGGDGGKK
jgi:hypothetical protein